MKLISAFACVSVLAFAGAATAQPMPPPAQPASPSMPATPAQTAPESMPAAPAQPMTDAAPATAPASAATAPTYGKGWSAKKCADAKTKGKTIPDGACPSEMAPK